MTVFPFSGLVKTVLPSTICRYSTGWFGAKNSVPWPATEMSTVMPVLQKSSSENVSENVKWLTSGFAAGAAGSATNASAETTIPSDSVNRRTVSPPSKAPISQTQSHVDRGWAMLLSSFLTWSSESPAEPQVVSSRRIKGPRDERGGRNRRSAEPPRKAANCGNRPQVESRLCERERRMSDQADAAPRRVISSITATLSSVVGSLAARLHRVWENSEGE